MKKPPARRQPSQQQDSEPRQVEVMQAAWSGPLPPPQALREFNGIVENGAERIFAAWEKETEHRHQMERRDLRLAYIEGMVGKIFALVFVLAVLTLAAYAISAGAQWAAGIFGAGIIGTVVWAFVKVNRPSRNGQ